MKLGLAALLIGSATAFAPAASTGGQRSALSMTATGTPTYTFTKSEEIFAEAQEVSCVPTCLPRIDNDMEPFWEHDLGERRTSWLISLP